MPPVSAPVERLRAEARAASDGGFGGWDAEDDPEDAAPPARVGSAASFGGASSADAGASISATSSAAGSVGGGSRGGRESPARESKREEAEWDTNVEDWGDDDDWGK